MTTTPLTGLRVVVTRTREQASSLVAQLEACGVVPIEVPVIATAEPADGGLALTAAVESLGAGDWVAVTSPTGAERFCAALSASTVLDGVRFAAVGPSTAAVLERHGITPDLLPPQFVAESLLDVFPSPPVGGGRVVLARAAVGRDVLPGGLVRAGWAVDVVEAYRTVPTTITDGQRSEVASADVVTFTASSTVERFIDLVGIGAVPPTVAVIGPITAATAREQGLVVDVEAAEHTIPGLVAALKTHFGA